MNKTSDAIDCFVLEMIAGTAGGELFQSIRRLCITGQITRADLVACVEKGFIDLGDYNLIIEEMEGFCND